MYWRLNGSTSGFSQVLGMVRKRPPPGCSSVSPSKTRRFSRIRASSKPGPRLSCGGVDREVLVVIALPGDPGVEEDVVAEDAEAEAGRFALARRDVEDRCRDRQAEAGEGIDRGQAAHPDFRVERAGRRARACGELTLRGRLRVDAEARREVDQDRFQVPDRDFAAGDDPRFVTDDDLGEAFGRVAGGLFVEELRRFGRAGVDGAGTGLPAGLSGFGFTARLLTFDDVDRLRRRGRQERRAPPGRRPSRSTSLPGSSSVLLYSLALVRSPHRGSPCRGRYPEADRLNQRRDCF